MKIYQKIARTIQAMGSCTDEGYTRHESTLECIQRDNFPRGAGIDGECRISGRSTKDKIIITFEYHFMSDHGSYDGWAEFDVIVTPSLQWGFDMKIMYYKKGNDRSLVQRHKESVSDYLEDLWNETLDQEVKEF